MILDLHRQGLTVSAIARELGLDRKTVRRCIARDLETPVYGPRKPRKRLIDPFVPYLRERTLAYPGTVWCHRKAMDAHAGNILPDPDPAGRP
jgi:transposase